MIRQQHGLLTHLEVISSSLASLLAPVFALFIGWETAAGYNRTQTLSAAFCLGFRLSGAVSSLCFIFACFHEDSKVIFLKISLDFVNLVESKRGVRERRDVHKIRPRA